MTSLDFTTLFKGNELTIDDIYLNEPNSPLITKNNNEIITTNNNNKDNNNNSLIVGDESTWILNQIESLGFNYSNNELSDELIKIFGSLLRERDHWQLQSQNLAHICSSLKSKIETFERNKETDSTRILVLTQDLNIANEKISSLKSEQRELKCAWLTEKGELETRCFQLQGLHTQLQGTLRKKEKDYEKLQVQLAKDIQKTQKPQKGQPTSSTPLMVISQPLQRNSTQGSNKPATLLDAEITSAKTTIATLELENSNLRNAFEDLTKTFEEFQYQMTNEMLQKTQLISQIESANATNSTSNFNSMSCLEQAKYVESRLDATTALLNSATEQSESHNLSTPHRHHAKFSSPLHLGGQNIGLLGTPKARPFNWIVQQANTEVKLLRQKAENLKWYIPPEDDHKDNNDYDEQLFSDNKENNTHLNEELTYQLKDITNKYKERMVKLKKELEEAIHVICEQDRLIHAALVGNMSSYLFESKSLNIAPNYSEEDVDENAVSDDDVEFDGNNNIATPFKRNQLNSSYDPSDWSAGFSELLPAVSPDTMAVLKAANFTTLPSQINNHKDNDDNQDVLQPRVLSSTLDEI